MRALLCVALTHSLAVWLLSSASALCAVYAEAARRVGGDSVDVVAALLQSRFFLLLLANALLAALATCAWLLKVLLLGKLRNVESQAVSQRLRDAVFEACLALSIFPEHDNDGANGGVAALGLGRGTAFLAAFAMCLFTKCFAVLVEHRVDYLDSGAVVYSPLKLLRLWVLLLGLLVADVALFLVSCSSLLDGGAQAHLLFAFEHAVLAVTGLSNAVRLGVAHASGALAQDGSALGWYERRPIGYYSNVVFNAVILGMYCLFFVMTLASYGLPLYMVGDFWRAFSRLMGCIGHLKRHRMLSHGLDSRFLDATDEDLRRTAGGVGDTDGGDRAETRAGEGDGEGAMTTVATCAICHDDMVTAASGAEATRGRLPKCMPYCGHCFHEGCLRSWLERQASCPVCRRPVDPEQDAARQLQANAVEHTREQIVAEAARMNAAAQADGMGGGAAHGGGAALHQARQAPVPAHVAAAADPQQALAAMGGRGEDVARRLASQPPRGVGAYYVDLERCTEAQLEDLIQAQAAVLVATRAALRRKQTRITGAGGASGLGGASSTVLPPRPTARRALPPRRQSVPLPDDGYRSPMLSPPTSPR